jgi:hypothetical protein
MMRAGAFALIAAAAAFPAAAEAAGGPIRTGEHGAFTRIVLDIGRDGAWRLEQSGRTAAVILPGRRLAFTTEDVWRRIPRTRVIAIEPGTDRQDTVVRIGLACDCAAIAEVVDGRWLAIDIHDTPPPGSPDPRIASPDPAALARAERHLLDQIERAADQGLIELTGPDALAELRRLLPEEEGHGDADDAAEAPPAAGGTRAAGEDAAASLAEAPADGSATGPDDDAALLAALGIEFSGERQVRARTVFDRDARRSIPEEDDPLCLPDEALDVARWSDNRPLPDQAVALRQRLVGEFDRPDPLAVRDLVRLHLRHGLGAEARLILRSFDVDLAEAPLLDDLARIVEDRAPEGPLARDHACPGRHGLWLALAGSPSALASTTHFETLRTAFEDMPPDLRALLAPALVTRFAEAGRIAEARILRDVALRPGVAPDREMRLALGRLAAAERDHDEAEAWLSGLVESGAANAPDAVLDLVRVRLAAGEAVPLAWQTDLRALAVEQRGGAREIAARALLAESRARDDDLREAFEMLASLAADRPEATDTVRRLAPRLLADADPERTGRGVYAEAAMAHAGLVPATPETDRARIAIAERLLALGLPNVALSYLDPALERGRGDARLVAARARVALGDGEAALALLEDAEGPLAAAIRARAHAVAGDFAAATDSLAGTAPLDLVLPYAWAAGDWAIAARSPDEAKAAMADYMQGGAPAEAAASDLSPEAAFRLRPPAMDRPSLAAARNLVTVAAPVRDFIEARLAGE